MSSSLKKPAAATFPKRTRTEWDAFIAKREGLELERKRLNREAAAIGKQIAELDPEIEAFLEHETAGKKEQLLLLKNFILSFQWVAPSAMAMAFKALGKLTADAKAALKAEIPDKKKLVIQWRAPQPSESAKAA